MDYSEKQIQIIEAAEELFSEKGFDASSVRDIAEQAKVNLAMISYYFGSKDKLLEAVFSYRFENTKLKLQGMLDNKEQPTIEKFYELIDYYVDRFRRHHCFHRIMVREQIMNSKGPIVDLLLNLKKANLELVRLLVQEGQKKKEFRKNLDISMMMVTLIGTINHVMSTPHYYRDMNNLQSLSDDELDKHIRKKLSAHLKTLFKAILTNED